MLANSTALNIQCNYLSLILLTQAPICSDLTTDLFVLAINFFQHSVKVITIMMMMMMVHNDDDDDDDNNNNNSKK